MMLLVTYLLVILPVAHLTPLMEHSSDFEETSMGHGYESEHGSSYDEVEEGDPLKDKLKFKKDLLVGLKNLKKSKLTALKSKLGKKDKKDKKDKCEIIWEEQKQPHCATQYEEVS